MPSIWPISGGPILRLSPLTGLAADRASAPARINRETPSWQAHPDADGEWELPANPGASLADSAQIFVQEPRELSAKAVTPAMETRGPELSQTERAVGLGRAGRHLVRRDLPTHSSAFIAEGIGSRRRAPLSAIEPYVRFARNGLHHLPSAMRCGGSTPSVPAGAVAPGAGPPPLDLRAPAADGSLTLVARFRDRPRSAGPATSRRVGAVPRQ